MDQNHTPEQIEYHLRIMAEAGLINPESRSVRQISGNNVISVSWRGADLTWQGHEFLDQIRKHEVWERAKSVAIKSVGAAGIEALKYVLPKIVHALIDQTFPSS